MIPRIFQRRAAEAPPAPEAAPVVAAPEPAAAPLAPVRMRRARYHPRNFEAATHDRLNGDFLTGHVDINEILRGQLGTLQGRARQLVRNADYPAAWCRLVKDNVVGHLGIQVQSRAANPRGDLDKLAAHEIEAHWRNWCENHCDYMGRMQFLDFQELATTSWATNGEFLLRKVYGKEAGPYGLQLQALDTLRLDPDYSVELTGDRRVLMGIELDSVGRPIAYNVTSGPSGSTYLALNGREYVRLAAGQVIHGFLPQEIGQIRGITPMAPVIMRLHHLSKYEQAALINARVGASTMGILENVDGDEDALVTDEADDDGPVFEVEPGTFRKIPKGWKSNKFDPAYPNGELPLFVKICLRDISGGVGVSYHGLTGDLESVNYSSGRIGELKERLTWMRLQTWETRALIRPVFDAWLREALIRQLITVRVRPLPMTSEEKYRAVAFRYKRWPWVDPLKDANAAKILRDMRARSLSDIIRDLGGDPEETWEEIAREEQVMARLGVATTGTTTKEQVANGNDGSGGVPGAGAPGADGNA